MTRQLNSQRDFDDVKSQFVTASKYREFSRIYHFNHELRIALTGMSVDEAVPRSKLGGPRRKIFEKMEQMDGRPIRLINSMAKKVGNGTTDADIFIAAHKGFVRLTKS